MKRKKERMKRNFKTGWYYIALLEVEVKLLRISDIGTIVNKFVCLAVMVKPVMRRKPVSPAFRSNLIWIFPSFFFPPFILYCSLSLFLFRFGSWIYFSCLSHGFDGFFFSHRFRFLFLLFSFTIFLCYSSVNILFKMYICLVVVT